MDSLSQPGAFEDMTGSPVDSWSLKYIHFRLFRNIQRYLVIKLRILLFKSAEVYIIFQIVVYGRMAISATVRQTQKAKYG